MPKEPKTAKDVKGSLENDLLKAKIRLWNLGGDVLEILKDYTPKVCNFMIEEFQESKWYKNPKPPKEESVPSKSPVSKPEQVPIVEPMFNVLKFENERPCYVCGQEGPGNLYFDPVRHTCAGKYHALMGPHGRKS